MPESRIILETGSGCDLHGGDYTKVAKRAVEDAIRHSSLSFVRSLGLDPASLDVAVTIGVARPERVDAAAVAAILPHGKVTVRVVAGGLDVPGEAGHDTAVIAGAAVAVRCAVPRAGD